MTLARTRRRRRAQLLADINTRTRGQAAAYAAHLRTARSTRQDRGNAA
ncbi:hypothetical protein ACFU51_14755 [Streptomyces sp. NPDC057430]